MILVAARLSRKSLLQELYRISVWPAFGFQISESSARFRAKKPTGPRNPMELFGIASLENLQLDPDKLSLRSFNLDFSIKSSN